MSGNNAPEQPLANDVAIVIGFQAIDYKLELPVISFDLFDELASVAKPLELPEYVCASIERYEQAVHRMRVLGYVQVQEGIAQKRAVRFAVLKKAIEVLGARNQSLTLKDLIIKILRDDPNLVTVKNAGNNILAPNCGETLLLYAAIAQNLWAMDTLLMMGADQEAPSPVIMRGMRYDFFRRVIQEHGVTPQILARLMINLNQEQIEDLREWLPNAKTQLFEDAIAIVDDMKTKRAAMLVFCSGLKRNDEGKLIKPITALGRFLASDGDTSVSQIVLSMLCEPYARVERPTPPPLPAPIVFSFTMRENEIDLARWFNEADHAAGEYRAALRNHV